MSMIFYFSDDLGLVMADDLVKRNFRVSFYDKVGFRAVGEKALTAILKDDVVDIIKLKNYCTRYPVHAGYRYLIWKVLLDVLPVHQQSHKFVMTQRREQYEDLRRALEVMRMIDEQTNPATVYLIMYLLERGDLCCGYKKLEWHESFILTASSVIDMVDCPVDAYWITAGLHQFFTESNFSSYGKEFETLLTNFLKRENPKLFTCLEEIGFIPSPIICRWHERCFAGVIQSEGCLETIWDILLGGGSKVLPYVSAQIFLALERPLLTCKTLAQCNELMSKTPFSNDVTDFACHKGIESWKKCENII